MRRDRAERVGAKKTYPNSKNPHSGRRDPLKRSGGTAGSFNCKAATFAQKAAKSARALIAGRGGTRSASANSLRDVQPQRSPQESKNLLTARKRRRPAGSNKNGPQETARYRCKTPLSLPKEHSN